MRINFMGTPEFAVQTLETLLASQHKVVLVVTGQDKPRGRGLKVFPTPVKVAAEKAEIPVYQPASMKSVETQETIKRYEADIFVVVAFRILPEPIIEIPPKGVINLHASLLPSYRGAAPIQWVLMNGEKRTGVTTFFIEKGVDTGDIILQKAYEIQEEDDAGTLHDNLARIGAKLVLETVDLIEQGNAVRRKQVGPSTRAPKIEREMCRIQWHHHSEGIINQIRAFSPFPGAFTYLGDRMIKIFRAARAALPDSAVPGDLVVQGRSRLFARASDQWVELLEIQLEGKKKMKVENFLQGIDKKILELGFK